MASNCDNERAAMMQYVALGSISIMADVAASKVLRKAFDPSGHHQRIGTGRGSNHAPRLLNSQSNYKQRPTAKLSRVEDLP